MTDFDTASKKQVETNPQDFVDLCFEFGQGNTTFKPALETIEDLQRLEQLFRAAMLAENLEDFAQALNENGNSAATICLSSIPE